MSDKPCGRVDRSGKICKLNPAHKCDHVFTTHICPLCDKEFPPLDYCFCSDTGQDKAVETLRAENSLLVSAGRVLAEKLKKANENYALRGHKLSGVVADRAFVIEKMRAAEKASKSLKESLAAMAARVEKLVFMVRAREEHGDCLYADTVRHLKQGKPECNDHFQGLGKALKEYDDLALKPDSTVLAEHDAGIWEEARDEAKTRVYYQDEGINSRNTRLRMAQEFQNRADAARKGGGD